MTSAEPGGQTLADVGGHVRLLLPPPAERVRSERGQAHRRGPLPCRDTERAGYLAPAPRWRERSGGCAQPRPPGSIPRRVDASSAVRKTRTPPAWPSSRRYTERPGRVLENRVGFVNLKQE